MANSKKAGFIFLILFISCDVNINKNFNIADKSFVEKDLIAINGSINIGRECVMEGNLSSINGSVYIESNSKIFGEISTVNGSITLIDNVNAEAGIQSVNGFVQIGKNNHIAGNITNINGMVSVGRESEIRGDITNVSGDIELKNTVVRGDISSNFGDIFIEDHSKISGSLIIENNNEILEKLRKVNILLADSSVIEGDLKNNNRTVLVTIYIEPGSRINGSITDVEIVDSKEKLEDF